VSSQSSATRPGSIAPHHTGIVLSPGIRGLRHLKELTGLSSLCSPAEAAKQGVPGDVVLVWGRKGSAQRALRYAREQSMPVWFLEDGWIRSSSRNAHSRSSYSLLIDREGVYYDSSAPSELENFLNQADLEFRADCDDAALVYARTNRQFLVDQEITKYNYCSAANVAKSVDSRPLVLVIDQTRDDASVRFGGMNSERFQQMLEAAIDENPEARIV